MLHFWKITAFLFALTVLVGCPTPPKTKPRVLLDGVAVTPPAPESPPPVAAAPPTSASQAQPASPGGSSARSSVPMRANPLPPPAGVGGPVAPRTGWVLWADWNKKNGRGQLLHKNATNLTFESRSPQGNLSVTVGQRYALWNGLQLGLGFEPRLANGQPVVHELDVAKAFDPLTTRPALLGKTGRIVVLDPGHGGENTGAKSAAMERCEKDYTLDWALRARPLLAARGWKVLLTRTTDIDLTLNERVAFADRAQADLFISLHFNSAENGFTRSSHGGLETYCLTPAGMPSHLTREFDDDPDVTFPNNAFDAENIQFAARLHQSMLRATHRKDRGIRRARFMVVLREQTRPAVLLEGGYLSDTQEARLIASNAYRQSLAEALAKALE